MKNPDTMTVKELRAYVKQLKRMIHALQEARRKEILAAHP